MEKVVFNDELSFSTFVLGLEKLYWGKSFYFEAESDRVIDIYNFLLNDMTYRLASYSGSEKTAVILPSFETIGSEKGKVLYYYKVTVEAGGAINIYMYNVDVDLYAVRGIDDEDTVAEAEEYDEVVFYSVSDMLNNIEKIPVSDEDKSLCIRVVDDSVIAYSNDTDDIRDVYENFVLCMDHLMTEGYDEFTNEDNFLRLKESKGKSRRPFNKINYICKEFDKLFKKGDMSVDQVIEALKFRGFNEEDVNKAVLMSVGSAIWEDDDEVMFK